MPNKQKVDLETKIAVVKRCLAGEIGVTEAGQEVGVSCPTVRGWIVRYETEGPEGFLPRIHNRVYPPELKLQVVKEYLQGHLSYLRLCKKYKISDPHNIRDWIKKYNAHEDFYSINISVGGSYMKQGRNTTQEERIKIAIECIASGKNYNEIALKYNVSYQQVRDWTLRYEKLGEVGLEDRRGKRKKDHTPRTELEEAQIEIERLKHKLHMAEMERDLLKKLDEIVRRDAYRK